MKKGLILTTIFLSVLLVAGVFCSLASAAETTVYVDSVKGADDHGGTTATSAFKTLNRAIKAVSGGGNIVLVSDLTLESGSVYTEPEHTGDIVISSQGSAKLYLKANAQYHLSGPTVFRDINIFNEGTVHFVADFHPITFDNGVNMTCKSMTKAVKVYGGYIAVDQTSKTDLDSHITIKSGNLFATVVGFVSQKGAETKTFTGTSYIEISGGEVTKVLCASADNHYSGSTYTTVSGGKISSLYTGGNATRRLDKDAYINVTGGEITALVVNNVIGDVTLCLDGGTVGAMSVSYGSDTIKTMAASSEMDFRYNTIAYPDAKIASYIKAIKSSGIKYSEYGYADIYVRQGANGTGVSRESPVGSLDAAISLLKDSGQATFYLTGDYKITGNVKLPAYTIPVTILGQSDGTLSFADGTALTFGGPTNLESVRIRNAGKMTLNADNHPLSVSSCDFSSSGVCVTGGSDSAKDVSLTLASGKYDTVKLSDRGGTYHGNARLTISAEADTVCIGASASDGKTEIEVTGGNTKTLDLTGAGGDISVGLLGGSIGNVVMPVQKPKSSLLRYNRFSISDDAVSVIRDQFDTVEAVNVIYLSENAKGNGLSPASPVGTLQKAYEQMNGKDATVVLCGKYTTNAEDKFPASENKVTFTSVYNGVDYRKTQDAQFIVSSVNLSLNGDTVFEHIAFRADSSNSRIVCNSHNVTFGEDILCYKEANISSHITLIGGSGTATENAAYTIRVASGEWNYYYASNYVAAASAGNADVHTVIDGGIFNSPVHAGGYGSFSGKTDLTVNGGIFRAGIYGSAKTSSSDLGMNTAYTLTINDGTFYGMISPAFRIDAALYGSYDVTVNGGDFAHLTDIKGTASFGGKMSSTLTIANAPDLYKTVEGTDTFRNYARSAADPWIIYHDGFYYYTQTGGSSIGIAKVANISEIGNAPLYTVFAPASGNPYSKNIWSPEIHYYSADDFGTENAGWYIYIACDNGDNINHRMYVLKSLSGDPMGPYGNPVTKEKNVPIKVMSKDDDTVNNAWSAGQTDIRIDGKVYALWVSELYEGSRRYQTTNISALENPWTMTGKAAVICTPTLDWEKHGSEDGIHPEVVEGGTAVYGDNGEIYIIYSGSGYWTVWYELGQMKYKGGDPLDITSWEKGTDPIFVKSDSVNGCGHASYTTTPDGKRWILYHAYTGTDTASGRFAFFEPYEIKNGNVVIGDGSTHPAPISTEYTITLNPVPLISKINGFGNFSVMTVKDSTLSIKAKPRISPSLVTLYGGIAYDPAVHGEMTYKYKATGKLDSWHPGLPTETGEYLVCATLEGDTLYAGISATFNLTMDESDPPEEDPDDPKPSDGGFNPYFLIVAAAVVVVGGGVTAAVLVPGKKKGTVSDTADKPASKKEKP